MFILTPVAKQRNIQMNENEVAPVVPIINDTVQTPVLENSPVQPAIRTDTPTTAEVDNVQKTFERKTYPEGTHKEPYKIGCVCQKCIDYKDKQLSYREKRKAKKDKAINKTDGNTNAHNTIDSDSESGGNGNSKAILNNPPPPPLQDAKVTQSAASTVQQNQKTDANKLDDDLLRFAPAQQPTAPTAAPVAPVPNEVNFSDFVTGHMLLMCLDYSFPFIAKNIYGRFVDKRYMYINAKGVEQLKLTPSEKKELEKSADEMVKILFKDIPPQYTFLIMYGMICFGKISMLNDNHFDTPPVKQKDEKTKPKDDKSKV